jgi:hypothetical protein
MKLGEGDELLVNWLKYLTKQDWPGLETEPSGQVIETPGGGVLYRSKKLDGHTSGT